MMAPSTAEFRAGSMVWGSDAMHTAMSKPSAGVLSAGAEADGEGEGL